MSGLKPGGRDAEARAAEGALAADRGYFDDGAMHIPAARALWCKVLEGQWYVATATVGCWGGAVSSREQRAALDWFFTRDAELVATFVGIDADMMRDRMRPLRQAFLEALARRPKRSFERIPLREVAHG